MNARNTIRTAARRLTIAAAAALVGTVMIDTITWSAQGERAEHWTQKVLADVRATLEPRAAQARAVAAASVEARAALARAETAACDCSIVAHAK